MQHAVNLLGRLGAGWSVHTNRLNLGQQSHILSLEEQDQIVRVISKADALDRVEQLRIGCVFGCVTCLFVFCFTLTTVLFVPLHSVLYCLCYVTFQALCVLFKKI